MGNKAVLRMSNYGLVAPAKRQVVEAKNLTSIQQTTTYLVLRMSSWMRDLTKQRVAWNHAPRRRVSAPPNILVLHTDDLTCRGHPAEHLSVCSLDQLLLSSCLRQDSQHVTVTRPEANITAHQVEVGRAVSGSQGAVPATGVTRLCRCINQAWIELLDQETRRHRILLIFWQLILGTGVGQVR